MQLIKFLAHNFTLIFIWVSCGFTYFFLMIDVQKINQLSTGYPQPFLDSEVLGKSPLDSTYKHFLK